MTAPSTPPDWEAATAELADAWEEVFGYAGTDERLRELAHRRWRPEMLRLVHACVAEALAQHTGFAASQAFDARDLAAEASEVVISWATYGKRCPTRWRWPCCRY